MSNALSLEQAREMGFDDAQIEFLIDQGLVSDARPVTWRPETLDDVNWIVSRARGYDAEEARVTEQYQRRLKAIAQSREWLSRYDLDCAAILAATLPKKQDGSYKRKFLDLEDGRVKLKQTGGGLAVAEADFMDFAMRVADGDESFPDAAQLCEAVRVERKETLEGVDAALKIGLPGWKASILKTPISAYLDGHPDATIPGVSTVPVSQVFEIERPKAEKGGAL